MQHDNEHSRHVTVVLGGGVISPGGMRSLVEIAEKYNLTFYATTTQNIKLLGASEENQEQIKKELLAMGMKLKGPGRFPVPKVCIGAPYCNLGLKDAFALSEKILDRFGNRQGVKAKYKIAISGCPASCAGSMLADIGIIATRKGYDLYIGGKGGPLPRTGSKVATGMTGDEIVKAVGRLADYHAAKTPTKQRLFKLLGENDFPDFRT